MTHPFAWLLTGLVLLASSLQEEDPKKPRRPNPFRKKDKVPSLVKLPEGYIRYARVPGEGIRPRLAPGREGKLALIYFKGDEAGGDLYFTRSDDDAATFSPSVRLNAEPGTVAACQGVHGGSIDVGPDGRAHVAWITAGEAPAVLYAREKAEGGFEEAQALARPAGLGCSTAVAVDATGQRYVFHAALGPVQEGEEAEHHRLWMSRGPGAGGFEPPVVVDKDKHGVSVHSGIAAHVDELMGTVFVLYRVAFPMKPGDETLSRFMRLLSSEDRGGEFKSALVDNWRGVRDPRSLAHLSQEEHTTLAAWETGGEVCWATIKRQVDKVDIPMDPKDEEGLYWRYHVSAAAGHGEIFMAWLEKPEDDLQAPPTVGWKLWVRTGRTPVEMGHAPDPPGNSAPVVFARAERGFTILY